MATAGMRHAPPEAATFQMCYGTEFAEHWRLNDRLGTRTYFCDPHSPWQKGGVENAIGRMRSPLPRKTDLATLPLTLIQAAVDRYNATPRKCLGWKTPAEAFSGHLKPLHFKCESTSPPSRGTRTKGPLPAARFPAPTVIRRARARLTSIKQPPNIYLPSME